jgi:hypothetical protein
MKNRWIGKPCTLALLLFPLSPPLLAQDSLSAKSDLVKLDFHILAENKTRIRTNDPALMPAYQALLSHANRLLAYGPVSVTDKTVFPPSGDKHDYMSIAPYFWPDPSKPQGIPYINRDGSVNPEVRDYPDKVNMPKLCENVYLLSLAYYFSGEEKYAKHAAELLRVWFLDTATRMNPNLKFGQAVKGLTEGRAAGLIDSRFFIWAIDGIDLIQTSTCWTPRDQTGIKNWFAAFLDWLRTSKIGQEESKGRNNHGVWYDAQSLSIALFLDSTRLADEIVARAAERLDAQMGPSGFFPLELSRNNSLHYSVFILNAFFVVAQLSEQTRLNLWTWTSPSGKTLKNAFQTLLPYITRQKPWTGTEITAFNFDDAVPLLLRGGNKFNEASCQNAIKAMDQGAYNTLLVILL